jgi:hypothetical protein
MRIVGNLVQLRGIVKSCLANIESFKFVMCWPRPKLSE